MLVTGEKWSTGGKVLTGKLEFCWNVSDRQKVEYWWKGIDRQTGVLLEC